MTTPERLAAAAVSVRLRRFWLGEVLASPLLADSDFADLVSEVSLRRVGSTLVIGTPYDFGDGDPFGGAFGEMVRSRVSQLSEGAVNSVTWEHEAKPRTRRQATSDDLDIHAAGDPSLEEYDAVLAKLRAHMPATASAAAREAVDALKLVGISRHRLWFAARTAEAMAALGTVPGARGVLVTAIQKYQKHELPLYRVIVDDSYWPAEEEEVVWWPVTHDPWPPLAADFPAPEINDTWADRGADTWTRGFGEWEGHRPPEDSALAPLLDWSDEHKALLLKAYNDRWAAHLEPRGHYDISWPPEGSLFAEGWALEGETWLCEEHDAERVDDCEECDAAQEESTPASIEPAQWEWRVTVETWESDEADRDSTLIDTERWHFLSTEVDPRDVEYE